MDQALDEFNLSQPVPLTAAEAAALAQARGFGVPDGRMRRRGGKRVGQIMVVRPVTSDDGGPEVTAFVATAEPLTPGPVAFMPEAPAPVALSAPAPAEPAPRPAARLTWAPAEAAATPSVSTEALRVGEAVAAAVSAALAAQSEFQSRLHESDRRAEALTARVAELEAERERMIVDSDARAANIAAERDRLADALADRVAAHEADREGLIADLREERERGLSSLAAGLAEGLSEILTARLLGALDDRLDDRLDERLMTVIETRVHGALDSHTALAEKLGVATAESASLEARVAHLTAQVDTARGWRERFGDLDELARPKPWWKFW